MALFALLIVSCFHFFFSDRIAQHNKASGVLRSNFGMSLIEFSLNIKQITSHILTDTEHRNPSSQHTGECVFVEVHAAFLSVPPNSVPYIILSQPIQLCIEDLEPMLGYVSSVEKSVKV